MMALQSKHERAQTGRANYPVLQFRESNIIFAGQQHLPATYPLHELKWHWEQISHSSTHLHSIRFNKIRRPLRNRIH